MVREDWVIGGNFNVVFDDVEKYGGRSMLRVMMDEFQKVIEDLAMVNIKSDKG